MTDNRAFRIIQLVVSEPIERNDGLYETTFHHPSLGGKLVLVHGSDRTLMLDALCVDPKEFDPITTMFKHLADLRKQLGD